MTADTRRTMTELQILCCMALPGSLNHAAGDAALDAYIGGLTFDQLVELGSLIEGWELMGPDTMHEWLTVALQGER